MIVSQESLVLEARIADDDARLAELNARHKAACSMTGDRRSRELRIIERQIRDTTKHKTEHQQRLRRISNAPPPPREKTHSKPTHSKPGRPRKDDLRQQAQELREEGNSWANVTRKMNKRTGEDKSENAYRNLLSSNP